jgi:hypothetical protein
MTRKEFKQWLQINSFSEKYLSALETKEPCLLKSVVYELYDLLQPKWIPVSERLPEREGRYAVIYESDSGRIRDKFTGDYHPQFGWSGVVTGTKITHWCRYPELPEVEE